MPPGHAFHWTREDGYVTQHGIQSSVIADDGVFDFGQSLVVGSPYRRLLANGDYDLLGLSGIVVGASSDGNIAVGRHAVHLPAGGGAWRCAS